MKKYLRLTQILWMVMAILSLLTTVYMAIIGAQENAIFCLMITLFCAVMYNMRRMFNRKIEREHQKQAESHAKNKS